MTDIRLFHTPDGGDVEFTGGSGPVELQEDSGLETAVYLSLFGGNERDPGTVADDVNPDHPHNYQWWGNHGEPKENWQRSETQFVLRSLPATSSNLLRVEDAAKRDLQWMLDTELASQVEAASTLTGVRKVSIAVRVVIRDKTYAYAFEADWGN